MGVTYDAGVLIAAERGDPSVWKRHRGLLVERTYPTVPAPVLAQAWRGGPRQALLVKLLASCTIEAMEEQHARDIGALLAAAIHDDVVDGAVVEGAARRRDAILTTDAGDIQRLVGACRWPLAVERV